MVERVLQGHINRQDVEADVVGCSFLAAGWD